MSRITIVEDDCFMREELADILEKEGYEVTQIRDFQNVYEEIQKSRPALVLLDINLPQKSGFEICKQLKEKNLCSVIILTSRIQIEDEIHGLKLPAFRFFCYPAAKGKEKKNNRKTAEQQRTLRFPSTLLLPSAIFYSSPFQRYPLPRTVCTIFFSPNVFNVLRSRVIFT